MVNKPLGKSVKKTTRKIGNYHEGNNKVSWDTFLKSDNSIKSKPTGLSKNTTVKSSKKKTTYVTNTRR